MYGVIGKIVTTPGARDALVELLIGIGDMPGCRSYVVALADDDPDAVWVTEVWDSADAHRASLQLPPVQSAIERGRPLIAGFADRVETTPVAGIGI